MFLKYISVSLLILFAAVPALTQPKSAKAKPVVKKDPFCDSLQLILSGSREGFLSYRYNEKVASVTTGYNTTLPSLGFDKKFVQVGLVSPYKQTKTVALPYYIATSTFTSRSAADQFFNATRKKILACIKPAAQDSSAKTGYARFSGLQLQRTAADQFVTAEMILLSDPASHMIIFRLFHNKASTDKGVMKNPPVIPVTVTNKYHYENVQALILGLLDYAPASFTAIRGRKLENQEWDPTYIGLVTFRQFNTPLIEYITGNLWNVYGTRMYFPDEAAALKVYAPLAEEIDRCTSAIPFLKYDSKDSKLTDKWWRMEHGRSDNEGKRYRNSIRLLLEKSQYSSGFYIYFKFTRNPVE